MRFSLMSLLLAIITVVFVQCLAEAAVPKVNCKKGCINEGVNTSIPNEYYSRWIHCQKPDPSAGHFEMLCNQDVGAGMKLVGGRSCNPEKGWSYAELYIQQFCKNNKLSNCSISNKLRDAATRLAGNACILTYYVDGEKP